MRSNPWTFELTHDPEYDEDMDDDVIDENVLDEGSLEIYEPDSDDVNFLADSARVAGFRPASILIIRPAGWDMSLIAAEVIAQALDGLVYFYSYDSDDAHREFDTNGNAGPPVTSLEELAQRIMTAYKNPRPYLERWAKQGEETFQQSLATDPSVAEGNDWSDI